MAIDLSIIIVNYNVQHFLRQTLESVKRSTQGLHIETFVVDNNSIDGSVDMVKSQFPEVNLIENKDNPGFSKANNQALELSQGKYALLLNPDTILQEDTLVKCFDFMEQHPEAGAVGAKMLDGSGQFLPESKRGFPSPWVSFCKATGLSVLFPKSKLFNYYHLGYLDKDETHSIDVLCGAFMFMRKSTLDEIGFLDEDFFMYGEDIDLSYRIKQSGKEIYYYPETQLIHFKGESTKKTSVNYVRVFYKAMIIFAKKHFAGRGAGVLVLMLNIAIFGRAFLSIIKRFTQRFIPQLLDLLGIFFGMVLIKNWWELYQFDDRYYFPEQIYINLGLYALIYVLSLSIHGVYRSHYRIGQIIRSILIALLVLLALYGLIRADFRFSRALVLFSGAWAIAVTFGLRLINRYIKHGDLKIGQAKRKRIFIVGSRVEAQNVIDLLDKGFLEYDILAKVAPEGLVDNSFHTTDWSKIEQLVTLEKPNEFIFCVKDLEWHNVIGLMNNLGPNFEYKMIGDDRLSIIGSKSKNTAGELYTVDFSFNISSQNERIKKRFLDIVISVFLVVFSFVVIWAQAKKSNYFKNIFSVLSGNKTMVSYDFSDTDQEELPELKQGLLNVHQNTLHDKSLIHRANLLYAKDYNVWKDVEIILRNLNKIS